MAWDAAHGAAFENVEVHLLVVGFGGDGAGALRVPQHQVGIGTHADSALAREQVEDFRRVGRGQRDEFVHRQTPAVDPGIPQYCHAVFDAGGAVGDAAEVVAAHGFLLGAEAAVVGGGGVQVARLQAAPQRLLVLAWAERRAHHITGGGGPVRVTVDTVVQQQVAGQHLAIHRLALASGIGDFIQCLAAGNVHQVQRRAEGFGNADGAAGRFAFNLRGARQRVGFRPGHALGEQFFLQVVHQLAVFGMHGGHRAQLQATLEAGHQGIVGGHDRIFVGHEMLEAVHPVLGHQLAHLFGHLFAPPGDGDVEAIVAGAFLRPATPGVEGLQQRLLRVGNDEVDDRGGAASQACSGAAEEVLAGHRAHERQLHVGVWVDAAGHQVLAAAVEDLAVGGRFEVLPDGADQAIGTQDIGGVTLFVGDHGGATDQQGHAVFLAG
ncbi:hypothetical protein D3C79_655660 [compost metagenome]